MHGVYQQPFAQPCGLTTAPHHFASFTQQPQTLPAVPQAHPAAAHYQAAHHSLPPHLQQHSIVQRHDGGLMIDHQFDLPNAAQSLHTSQQLQAAAQVAHIHSQQQMQQIQPPQPIFIATDVSIFL